VTTARRRWLGVVWIGLGGSGVAGGTGVRGDRVFVDYILEFERVEGVGGQCASGRVREIFCLVGVVPSASFGIWIMRRGVGSWQLRAGEIMNQFSSRRIVLQTAGVPGFGFGAGVTCSRLTNRRCKGAASTNKNKNRRSSQGAAISTALTRAFVGGGWRGTTKKKKRYLMLGEWGGGWVSVGGLCPSTRGGLMWTLRLFLSYGHSRAHIHVLSAPLQRPLPRVGMVRRARDPTRNAAPSCTSIDDGFNLTASSLPTADCPSTNSIPKLRRRTRLTETREPSPAPCPATGLSPALRSPLLQGHTTLADGWKRVGGNQHRGNRGQLSDRCVSRVG